MLWMQLVLLSYKSPYENFSFSSILVHVLVDAQFVWLYMVWYKLKSSWQFFAALLEVLMIELHS